MNRLATPFLLATLCAGPVAADQKRIGVEPFLSTLGDSQTLDAGEDIYTYWCAACHNPGKPGSVALMVIHEAPFPSDLSGKGLEPDYVRYLVRNGQAAMPHFRKTQISDPQLDALAEYLAAKAE